MGDFSRCGILDDAGHDVGRLWRSFRAQNLFVGLDLGQRPGAAPGWALQALRTSPFQVQSSNPQLLCVGEGKDPKSPQSIPAGPLTVRLVKVVLPTGEVEVLITNLDRTEASVEELAELYARRWGVEEEYKFAKSRSELERWSGKSHRAVEQDFHGRILLG